MKNYVQLNELGFFVGKAEVDESPLEPGVYLVPAGCVEAEIPEIKEGKIARWDNGWVYEDLPKPPQEEPQETKEPTYAELRAKEYPSFFDYLDGIVKNDKSQIQQYIDACRAVKEKYPKPQE